VFKQEDNIVEVRDDDTNYPVKFQLNSKYFKAKINHIRDMSPILLIQKSGDDPLQLTFDKAQTVGLTSTLDSSKINLQSTVDPEDIFSVGVYIDYIKPFSNSCIGDEVFIAADKRKRISFMTRLDQKGERWACWVKIYTDIKEYKNEL
jgi:hypothetical protein